jgi:xylan 1,4-beta-xylosidase
MRMIARLVGASALAGSMLVAGAMRAEPAPRQKSTGTASTKTATPPSTPERPPPRMFANPILPGMYPDPSICRVGQDFFLVTSSFEYFPGIPIFRSRDLVHWRQIGNVLTERRQLDLTGVPSSGGIYASTIRHADGQFYVISTLVGAPANRGGNFYVTATDPAGPWSDPVWLDKEGFDPSLTFIDGQVFYLRDGKGSDFSHPRVHQATLDIKTGKLLEPARVIWSGTGGVWPEGAHLYRLGTRFYLFAAEGGTEYGHAEMVGRAPSPWGPFQPSPGNPVLSHRQRTGHPIQATGHLDLVQLADQTTWAVFLGIRPHDGEYHHLGRETFLAPVAWNQEGWPVVGNAGTVELEMAAPNLPSHPYPPQPTRDEFDHATLGPAWNFVRNPDPHDFSLSDRPGFLRLSGSPVTLDDIGAPSLVARRQQNFKVRCSAALDFAPLGPNEEAGLTIRANEKAHYDLAVRQADKGREAMLVSRIGATTTVVGRAPLTGGGQLRLQVTADEASYRFAVEVGRRTTVLGTLPTRALAAEEVRKHGGNYFTGAYVGVYATGKGSRSKAPADFDWFECQP